MALAFSQTLYGFNDQEITDAFKTWMRDKRELPSPSDILELCEKQKANQSRFDDATVMSRDAAMKREKKRIADLKAGLIPMNDQDFEQWLQRMKDTNHEEKKEKKKIEPHDSAKFDVMPDYVKSSLYKKCRDTVRRPKY